MSTPRQRHLTHQLAPVQVDPGARMAGAPRSLLIVTITSFPLKPTGSIRAKLTHSQNTTHWKLLPEPEVRRLNCCPPLPPCQLTCLCPAAPVSIICCYLDTPDVSTPANPIFSSTGSSSFCPGPSPNLLASFSTQEVTQPLLTHSSSHTLEMARLQLWLCH